MVALMSRNVVGALLCGALITITQKAENFQKPWFFTWMMFVGMTLALILDGRALWQALRQVLRPAQAPLQVQLVPNAAAVGHGCPSWSQVKRVSVPASFDLLATALASFGFLYIAPSVFQLLRGIEPVFVALLRVCFPTNHLPLTRAHWTAVMITVAGVTLVGCASLLSKASFSPLEEGGVYQELWGMALVVMAQAVQAAQVVAEEHIVIDKLSEIQVAGFEGMWGALIMMAMALVLHVLPGIPNEYRGDTELDGFAMLFSNLRLSLLVLFYTISCTTYNICGIGVSKELSSLYRVMLETFRTCLVWIFGLTVHYCFDEASPFGEAWTRYSWLELGGFAVLVLAQKVYKEADEAQRKEQNHANIPAP